MPDMVNVRVVLVVSVDRNAHNETYGRGTSSKAVTDDVRSSVINMVQQSSLVDECGATVAFGR